jgi:hypothetical protein
MSRQDDERELRKLEYLDKRGVATFADTKRRKELARKLAIQDFEVGEQLNEAARGRMSSFASMVAEKKGTSN